MLLRSCYAMSGTDVGYASTRCLSIPKCASCPYQVQPAIALRACYAMSGTDLAAISLVLR
eukprot:3940290-Rhodomonas_salina.2